MNMSEIVRQLAASAELKGTFSFSADIDSGNPLGIGNVIARNWRRVSLIIYRMDASFDQEWDEDGFIYRLSRTCEGQ
jgi:hypothetical protein